ncbi:MAG TPA: hypothetical protein VJA19_07495 [Pseudomonas sp.]|nr:hypothetical protein [Pseudomonas sp.]
MPKYLKFLKGQFEDGKLLAITQGNLALDASQGTRRFTTEELQRYAYRVNDGQLNHTESGKLQSTIMFNSHDKSGMAAFVISPDDTIYLFNHYNKTDKVAHSSFVGKFAKGAGEIMVSKGKVKLIHAHSGHFRPNALNIYHVVKYFRDLGVLAIDAKVGFVSNPFPNIGVPPPTYAASVQLTCILDKQEKEAVLHSEQSIQTAKQKILHIEATTNETAFGDYKNAKLIELRTSFDEFQAMLNTEEMVQLFGYQVPQRKEIITSTEQMNFEGYKQQLIRDIKKLRDQIEDHQQLIDDLNSKRETISVIYNAPEFLSYVEANMGALKANIAPAFYSM